MASLNSGLIKSVFSDFPSFSSSDPVFKSFLSSVALLSISSSDLEIILLSKLSVIFSSAKYELFELSELFLLSSLSVIRTIKAAKIANPIIIIIMPPQPMPFFSFFLMIIIPPHF